MKKRRKRRVFYNWEKEIQNGNTNHFYNSTDYDIWKEQVLENCHHECQFFAGKWTDGIHKPYRIEPRKATIPHHIKSIKERPDLALDVTNGVALCFEAHEIIEGRAGFKGIRKEKKKPITEERWE